MTTINDITNETFYNMEKYHQIVIDYVEKVEDALSEDNVENNLGHLSYEINNLLEIYNQNYLDDIVVLNQLKNILEIEKKYR